VRDKIPELLKREGRNFKLVEIKDDNDFFLLLLKKLKEEVNEFLVNNDPEEIADILEVLETILRVKGWNENYIRRIKERKKAERGGFDKRYLIEIENNI